MGALRQVAEQVPEWPGARVQVAFVQLSSAAGLQLKSQSVESLSIPRILGDDKIFNRLGEIALKPIFRENGVI